jgi:hypothetical protein
MATPSATTTMNTTVTDAAGNTETIVGGAAFPIGVGIAPVDQEVVLTNAVFTALVVPAGAKVLRLRTNGAVSLTLKGVTGDTGFPITPGSNPLADDCYWTLGANPSIGILNGGASPVTVRCIWM